MPFTHQQLADIFAHHDAIRVQARALAEVIVDHTPPSADQTHAIRLLRQAVTTANTAIALKGRF